MEQTCTGCVASKDNNRRVLARRRTPRSSTRRTNDATSCPRNSEQLSKRSRTWPGSKPGEQGNLQTKAWSEGKFAEHWTEEDVTSQIIEETPGTKMRIGT